jgi:glycosyltransferase involved in cell wall biosynthesis
MRYAWDQFEHYFGPERLGAIGSAAARPVLAWLARWDRRTAPRVHRFVANSAFVAGRIGRYYNRRASVVHPPVDVSYFTPALSQPRTYALVVSALVPYKRLEVAIAAAGRLGMPLKIVGTGPDRARLGALATSHVEFLGAVDEEKLRELYRGARAFLLPGEEDFGIAPVEAMACGTPVIALARGGALETVIPEQTGLLVEASTAETFAEALDAAGRMSFDPLALAAHAGQFSTERFETAFRQVLDEVRMLPPAC